MIRFIAHILLFSMCACAALAQGVPQRENREEILRNSRYLLSIYKSDEAISMVSSLVKPGEFDEELQAELANCYFQSARYDRAQDMYRSLSETVPDRLLYRIRTMLCDFRMGDYPSCIADGHVVLQKDSIPAVLTCVGDSFLKMENSDSALWYYGRALERKPDYESVLSKAATICLNAHQYDRVISLTKGYSMNNPDNTSILPLKGMAHYWLEEYEDAIKIFEHQKEVGNNSFSTHFYLGQSYWHTNIIYRAEEELLKAWQVDSTKANLAYTIAVVKSESRLPFRDVAPWLEKACVLLQPDPAIASRIFQQYGYEYCKQMNWENARDSYLKANSYTPESSIVQYNVGYCYEKMKDYKNALIWYRKALSYATDDKARSLLNQRIEDVKQGIFMAER